MLIRSVIILVLSAIGIGMYAQRPVSDAPSIAQIKKGVEEAASRTETIASGFTQEKEMSILDEPLRSSGSFYFKKERQLRWEYVKPYSYIIVISNDRITIRDDQKTSQFDTRSNKVFAEVNRIIVGSIRGTLLKDEQNFSARYEDGGTAWVVKLTPLSTALKSSLKEITIYFSKTDFTVDRLDMTEHTGDKTRIRFTGKKINGPIPDEKFTLR